MHQQIGNFQLAATGIWVGDVRHPTPAARPGSRIASREGAAVESYVAVQLTRSLVAAGADVPRACRVRRTRPVRPSSVPYISFDEIADSRIDEASVAAFRRTLPAEVQAEIERHRIAHEAGPGPTDFHEAGVRDWTSCWNADLAGGDDGDADLLEARATYLWEQRLDGEWGELVDRVARASACLLDRPGVTGTMRLARPALLHRPYGRTGQRIARRPRSRSSRPRRRTTRATAAGDSGGSEPAKSYGASDAVRIATAPVCGRARRHSPLPGDGSRVRPSEATL